MSIKLIIRDVTVQERNLTLDLKVFCDRERATGIAPRIEVVFDNGQDNRRLLMPQESFLPVIEDKIEKYWVVRARYTFLLKHIFWYGTWEDCSVHFDIDYDGTLYESVPFELDLYHDPEKGEVKMEEGASDEDDEEEYDNEVLEIPDSFELTENSIEIKLGQPCEVLPPVQPNKIQVLLGLLIRLINGVIGFVLLPWYCIDVLGILLLPTERKDPKMEQYGFLSQFVRYVAWRYFSFCRNPKGRVSVRRDFLKIMYQLSNAFHRKKKTVLFLSNRRDDLSGNFEFIHKYMEENPGLEMDYWLHTGSIKEFSLASIWSLAHKCGKAKVILVDDYVPYIRNMMICEDTKIIQLWHACGAFKTFGFSRLNKKGGPKQSTKTHRDYNYCFVSSDYVAKYYAEGFGLAREKVIPYGVPRTDMFFDEQVKKEKREMLYKHYPRLKGKKVILFAPTFRGNGKMSAYYDEDCFDPNLLARDLPDDYAIIIKHHPFVVMKYHIKEKYKKRIFDFSMESEINDLLFITDILITDYSSVIYEASLLNIPMLFYAYDLEDYIATRDFYFEFDINVPGKIVRTQDELTRAIINKDFEHEKVEKFCEKNFDIRDGKSSERIAKFITKLAAE